MKLRFLILTIFGLLLVTFMVSHVSNSFKESLIETNKDQLLSIAYSSSSNIETYFHELTNTMHTMANGSKVMDAIYAFTYAYDKFQKENLDNEAITLYLQDRYIHNNPFPSKQRYKFLTPDNNKTLYDINHEKFHNYFLNEQKNHGYYDMFLIDTKGNVLYSVDKESDFATNLLEGASAKTALATVYKKALKLDKQMLVFQDFTFYKPSNDLPAAFLAIPIFDKKRCIGVFAAQIPIDKIDSIMRFNGKSKEVGLGQSGETYLVGNNLFMRTNSRFINTINNPLVKEKKSTIGIIRVDTSSVKKGLNEEKGSNEIIENYRGVRVLSAYMPIKVFEYGWVILAEINEAEVLEKVQKTITILFLESLAIMGLFLLIVNNTIRRYFIAPIEVKNKNLLDEIENKEQQLLLSQSIAEEYKQAFDLVSIISKTDTKGIITYVNEKFCTLTGYRKDELIGHSHNILRHPNSPPNIHKKLWETISSKRIWKGVLTNKNKNQEDYTIVLTIIPILDDNSDIKEFMSIVYNHKEKKKQKDKL